MGNWFSSDLHFSHDNIIQYCGRPFKNANEMDEALYANLLATISAGDTLWILGDVAMKSKDNAEKVAKRLSQMPFTIKIIAGNHDRGRMEIYTRYGLLEHRDGRHLYVIDGNKVSMGHYPVENQQPENGVIYLNGHVHEAWKFQLFGNPATGINTNVGVDVWDMKPITIDQILEERTTWLSNI